MFQYIVKRTLIFIPTFFVISLLIFGLSKMAPGDPVDLILVGGGEAGKGGQRSDLIAGERAYAEKSAELGLDKPSFYFSLTSAAYPDTLYTIQKSHHRELVSRLIDKYGNATPVWAYYKELRAFEFASTEIAAYYTLIKSEFGPALTALLTRVPKSADSLSNLAIRQIVDEKKEMEELTYSLKQISNNAFKKLYEEYEDQSVSFQLDSLHTAFSDADRMMKEGSGKIKMLYDSIKRPTDSIAGLRYDAFKAEYNKLEKQDYTSPLLAQLEVLTAKYEEIKANPNPSSLYVPTINLYGMDNQYHNWITNFMMGDFGTSYLDNRPVSNKLSEALWWTLLMNLIAILLSYLISIPLGVRGSVWKKDSQKFYPFFGWLTALSTLSIFCLLFFGSMTTTQQGEEVLRIGDSGIMIFGFLIAGITFVYGIAAIFMKEDTDNKSSIFIKLLKFIIGFSALVANIAFFVGISLVFETMGWSASWSLGLIFLLLMIEIIAFVYILGSERLVKIMSDTGDFFLYVSALWFWVILFWGLLFNTITFFFSFGFVAILAGLFLAWDSIKQNIFKWIASPVALYAAYWLMKIAYYNSYAYYIIAIIGLGVMGWGIAKSFGLIGERDPEKISFKLTNRGLRVRGNIIDNISTIILFVLYSLPSFWIGTIFIVFVTTPEYGMDWFPTGVGIEDLPEGATWWDQFVQTSYELVLPVFCITYGSFAYLSRQMRGSMLSVIRQDYIRTAKAKGLSEEQVTWKHAFRNSLFPIITLFSSVFPRALSGAIAIELIFRIPGMGTLVLSSIIARDWPVVFTVAMFAAILTMIGNLIADMLYAVVDPRVSYS